MTASLYDLLTEGEPDLPPAPRHVRHGRHRAPRGWVGNALTVLVIVLGLVGVVSALIRFAPAPSDRPAPPEPAVYPTPVPGAPPQAPHAGWPDAATTIKFYLVVLDAYADLARVTDDLHAELLHRP